MKAFGSQIREILRESGYTLVGRLKGVAILEAPDGVQELWYANDNHVGYTIQVGRWGYEYGKQWRSTDANISEASL